MTVLTGNSIFSPDVSYSAPSLSNITHSNGLLPLKDLDITSGTPSSTPLTNVCTRVSHVYIVTVFVVHFTFLN